MDFTVGIVSRNLATTSNFVEFRDIRNLHVFRGNECRVGHLAHFLNGTQGATCQAPIQSS